ncbi:GDSL-type esterase/lipase family protein [Candidatus Flexifilum breve]|uniref:SGNH/GDSL hydrolase family protein n=1 Tax=Candidatus Flexifilum breve TaxID=3140694 RepID=UPI0031CCCBA6
MREDYGLTNVEVINAGVQGYTTWHTLSNFEFRMLELDPDLIIFYQSVIDISGRAANPDCYRGANLLRGLDPRNVMVSTYNQGTFSISTLYRFLTIKLGLERDPADPSSSASETYITCGDGQTYADAEAYALNPPVYYERNLRSLIGIAQIQGVDLLLSTWAYDRADPNAVPEWRAAADEQNAIVTRLADQYDLPYIDFATVAPEGIALWVDHLHLNGEGSRLQAEAYAAYLVEQGIIPAS